MSRTSVITSKDNANIKLISQLQKSPKKRREEGVFVLEGLRLCLDAIQNGFIPRKAFFSSSFLSFIRNFPPDQFHQVCIFLRALLSICLPRKDSWISHQTPSF